MTNTHSPIPNLIEEQPMSNSKDPIGFMGKMNAGVLLAVTPEYTQIKTIQRAGVRAVPNHGRQT